MNCTIKIAMDNAAFADSPSEELARILRELAEHLEIRGDIPDQIKVYDSNGNSVGLLRVQSSRKR